MKPALPAYSVKIVAPKGDGHPYIEVVWRSPAAEPRPDGSRRQVKRRLGAAWHELAPDGEWRRRKGAPPDGWFVRGAQPTTLAAADLVRDGEARLTRQATERAAGRATFRRLAEEWLALQVQRGAKPSYLRNCRSMLAEPGIAHRRGTARRRAASWRSSAPVTLAR